MSQDHPCIEAEAKDPAMGISRLRSRSSSVRIQPEQKRSTDAAESAC